MSLQDSQDWLAIALRSGRETLGHGVSQRRLKKRRAWARAESIRPLPIASPRRGLAILSVVWPIADLRRPYEVSLSTGNIMRGRTGRGKVFHLATICLPIGRLINCRAASYYRSAFTGLERQTNRVRREASSSASAQTDQIVNNCMRGRGYNVLN